MTNYRFGPAYSADAIVFGASRPGYNAKRVSPTEIQHWLQFMQDNGIKRVVCLLPKNQLAYYEEDLLKTYKGAFGVQNVLSAPIEDYHLSSPHNLDRILAFLKESNDRDQKVVVHCSGGSGRTGHVLAAWLVHEHGLDVEKAIQAIENAHPPRNPLEAIGTAGITRANVVELLEACTSKTG